MPPSTTTLADLMTLTEHPQKGHAATQLLQVVQGLGNKYGL
ncbi:hypothetical protein HaLaN_07769, partial [Haematococcus lacustris]